MKNAVEDGTIGQTVFVGKESGMSKAANCYVLGCGHILGLLKQLIQDYVCTPPSLTETPRASLQE